MYVLYSLCQFVSLVLFVVALRRIKENIVKSKLKGVEVNSRTVWMHIAFIIIQFVSYVLTNYFYLAKTFDPDLDHIERFLIFQNISFFCCMISFLILMHMFWKFGIRADIKQVQAEQNAKARRDSHATMRSSIRKEEASGTSGEKSSEDF